MTDTIFNPKHYMQGSHECIDEIKAMLTPDEFKGFLKGNIIKYRYRANLKNGKEDLAKADNYAYYLMHGTFKKVKDNDGDDSTNTNDLFNDVFGHILAKKIPNPEKLLSSLEKLSQVLEHPKFIDNYKGKKITNKDDLMAFNLFSNLKNVMSIAELAAGMYRQKDLNEDTSITLRCISDYMTTGSARTIDKDNRNFDKFLIVFKDKSKLHLKAPRGYDFLDVFKPNNICAWQNVCADRE